MAETIKGLRIDLSLKDMGVGRTITELKRSFRTLNSDLKLSSKNFEYTEKSTQSYKRRLEELDSAIQVATKNVEDLENEYYTVAEAQGHNSKQAQALRAEYNRQATELKFLKDDLNNTSDAFKEFTKQQEIANSKWTKASDGFGKISSGLDTVSGKLTSTGKTLTNGITKPALVADGALTAMVGKLGFDRLVGLDSAKAKLEGLGYSTKEVGKISDQVANGIKGGMTTMAEGTDVAAGALASGVKEGKELEKYIKLVGDASVGANRPVSEMAMIFNRVQGQGKLMTEELNSVEQGMPGFTKAMAKHLKVPQEEFRKMVTDGEVSSKDFLTVMEDFAGGMSSAYSKSFKGMWQNSKAYIGMIGESLLSGVFEKSKGSLREFEKLLQSPGAQKWAKETGEKLATGIGKMSDAISGIVSWFNSLDKGTQKSIASIMKWSTLILIGIGPVLTIFGKFAGVLAGTFGGLSKFTGFMGKLTVESKTAGSVLKGFTALMPKTGAVIGAVANPIGLTVLAIGALVAGLVIAYKKSETFRNIVNGAFSAIVTGLTAVWNGIKTFLQPVIDAIVKFGGELKKTIGDFWAENGAQFMEALGNIKAGFVALWEACKPAIDGIGTGFASAFGVIKNIVVAVMPVITGIMKVGWLLIQSLIVSVWNNIKGIITGALNVIMGVIKVFTGIFTADFSLMWEGVKQIFAGAFTFLWNLVQLWFVGKIFGVFKLGFSLIRGAVSSSLGGVRVTFTTVLTSIWNIVKSIFTNIWKFISNIFSLILKVTRAMWNFIKLAVTNPVRAIYILVRAQFNLLSKIVRVIFTGLSKVVKAIWTGLKNAVVNTAKVLYNTLKNRFELLRKILNVITKSLSSAIRATWNFLKNAVVKTVQVLYSTVRNVFNTMSKILKAIASGISKAIRATFNVLKNGVIKTIRLLYNTLRGIFNTLRKVITGIVKGLKDAVTGNFTRLKDNAINLINRTKDSIVNGFKAMYDKGVSWISKLKNFIGDSVSGFKKIAEKLGKGVANSAISGLNAMIDGINTLSDKIMSEKLIKKKIPKLSTGTAMSPQVKTDSNGFLKRGTKAIVNDKGLGNASGANGHRELIYRKGGKVEKPIGRNKQVRLRRGDAVYNGAQTKSLLPHLSTGTLNKDMLKKARKHKKHDEVHGDVAEQKGGGGNPLTAISDGAKGAWNWTEKQAKKAKDAFGKAIGDVWDYAKDPMKLINKMLKHFGVNFDGIGGAMGGTIDWAYKGLKKGMKDLLTGWFDDSGGDGDSSYIDLSKGINFPFSPNGKAPGYPFDSPHYGVDLNYVYDKLYSVFSGKATARTGWNGGFGNMVDIVSGATKVIYGHMSKHAFSGSKNVKPGDYLGVSGNTGRSSGPHLHFEVQKNGVPIDPLDWLKKNNGKSGGSKSASKWKPEVIKALKMNGLPTSAKYVNAWIKQIDTESSGNANAVGGTDGLADGRATGLVQVKPPTFHSNKFKGHGNIKNGLDNLLAGIRYAKRRYGADGMLNVIGKGHGYATGGVIKDPGLYNLTEEKHEEIVIPTNPKRSTDAMKLLAYASNKVQGNKNRNKRPNQLSNGNTQVSSNDNTQMLQMMAQQLEATREQNAILLKMLGVTQNIEEQPKGMSERNMSKAQGKKAQMMAYNMGGKI